MDEFQFHHIREMIVQLFPIPWARQVQLATVKKNKKKNTPQHVWTRKYRREKSPKIHSSENKPKKRKKKKNWKELQ